MIISIIGYKGGVGKSTSTLHLSACLAKHGKTLAIDGDLNASLLDWESRGEGFPFTVAHKESAARLGGNQFEFVVIDTPARPEPKQLRAIAEGCDRLIVATAVDGVSMAALRPAVEDLKALKAEYRVLLTLVPPTGNAGLYARETLIEQGVPVLRASIRRYAAYQRAGLMGCLIWDIPDENSLVAGGDYEQLAAELLG